MGAAGGFRDDRVDDAEPQQILRGDLHGGRGIVRAALVAPQDRGGALRRDDAVDGVFQHQHRVGGGDRDGAARAALADDDGDVRHAEREAGFRGAGDGFGLAALLGLDAGEGAGGVDEGEDRQAEAVGGLHQPHRLAVALGPGHAEIVPQPRLGGRALLLADHADRAAAEAPEAAEDRLVLAEAAIAGQRREFLDEAGTVIDEMWSLRVTGDLRLLPGGEGGVDLGERLRGLRLQAPDLLADRDGAVALAQRLEFLELRLEFRDGLLEVEIGAHHRHRSWVQNLVERCAGHPVAAGRAVLGK
ncbi:hypothetical protein CHKEEEPN_4073 [Methylorubrum podarium]|nr:hypothetical protein CHKEEEPN_4073 [Methylorubrum podarium]